MLSQALRKPLSRSWKEQWKHLSLNILLYDSVLKKLTADVHSAAKPQPNVGAREMISETTLHFTKGGTAPSESTSGCRFMDIPGCLPANGRE